MQETLIHSFPSSPVFDFFGDTSLPLVRPATTSPLMDARSLTRTEDPFTYNLSASARLDVLLLEDELAVSPDAVTRSART